MYARVIFTLLLILCVSFGAEGAKFIQTQYTKPFKAVVEFYFDNPEKIGPALGWVSNLVYVLSNPPYNYSPEDIDIVVVSHGRELPVFAKENRKKYESIVERIESLSFYGVKFTVCSMAARQFYGYSEKDFYPFVTLVPSALTELIHWQQMGYGLLIPQVLEVK
ncbi:MAG: DsrE family protein [Hydrogenobacter sp.]